VDTFSTWFEPEIATDAVRVLRAAGYRVKTAPWPGGKRPICCGRTFLNSGLVDEARQEMVRLRDALLPLVDGEDAIIVGLEPSCLLTLRDELPALLPDDRSRRLADAALLFEEAGQHDQAVEELTRCIADAPEDPTRHPTWAVQDLNM
jgi:Fe-S oxidoreductase